MAKFCQNCGSPLEGGPKFCPSCGAQVMDAPQQEAPKPSEQPPTPQPSEQQGLQNPPVERQAPQPPMKQEAAGQPQPIMRQNGAGQNFGQQPFGGQTGQGNPAAYGMGMMGAQAFNSESYVPDEGIFQMFLRYDNRLNRKRYIMRGLALIAGITVFGIVLTTILVVAGVNESTIATISSLIGFAGAVPAFMLVIRRLHDLDRPTWWIIGNFIPVVNIAMSLYLLFAKGTVGPNQYGPDPLEGMH